MSRPGDWNCRSCQHLNFQRRDTCQRCGDFKSGGGGGGGGGGELGGFGGGGRLQGGTTGSPFGFTTGSDVRPGDWYCTAGNCGTHNFANRSSCFKCGVFKDDDSIAAAAGIDTEWRPPRGLAPNRSGWKIGDWICTRFGCSEHNFASRLECFRCNAPRDYSNRTSYSSAFN